MKKYYVTVNGNRYEVEVEEIKGDFEKSSNIAKNDDSSGVKEEVKETIANNVKPELKEQYNAASVQGEKLECPMPGTILSISVKIGDNVKKGQLMFILEAMKMENEIVAPRDGKILAINVDKGSSVNSGDLLVVIG